MADAARTDNAGGVLVLDDFQHAQLRRNEARTTQTLAYDELQRKLRDGEVAQHLRGALLRVCWTPGSFRQPAVSGAALVRACSAPATANLWTAQLPCCTAGGDTRRRPRKCRHDFFRATPYLQGMRYLPIP